MANRIISQMNNIKNNAPAIGSFYSKRYLQFGINNPAQIQRAAVNSINMYFRVGGYDLYDNRDNNHEKVTALAGQITSSLAAIRQPFSYTLHGAGNGIDAVTVCALTVRLFKSFCIARNSLSTEDLTFAF